MLLHAKRENKQTNKQTNSSTYVPERLCMYIDATVASKVSRIKIKLQKFIRSKTIISSFLSIG